jgi:ArsR family transcriptional regulator
MVDRTPGWKIGQAIAAELDVALTALNGYFFEDTVEGVDALIHSLPPDLKTEFNELLSGFERFITVLDSAAELAGVQLEADYSTATMAIRDLTLGSALEQVAEQLSVYGMTPDTTLPLDQCLVDLILRKMAAAYQEIGLDVTLDSPQMRYAERSIKYGIRILRDGDLHTRFWHWMDRFYYQYYSSWRETRQGYLEDMEKKAIAMLGAREKTGVSPDLAWLPEKNPVIYNPTFNQAIREGLMQVFFWVEPFGMPDTWGIQPGRLLISFGEPGQIFTKYEAFVDDVAERAKALADPTRLVMLRMIRHLGMVNTEIANYLGIARPTISLHAKMLREAGLIRSQQDGRVVRHEINPEEIRRLFRDLEKVIDLPPAPEDGE